MKWLKDFSLTLLGIAMFIAVYILLCKLIAPWVVVAVLAFVLAAFQASTVDRYERQIIEKYLNQEDRGWPEINGGILMLEASCSPEKVKELQDMWNKQENL